jgi:hypothetical protein
MDQRGVFSVCHDDFHTAQKALDICPGWQRKLRKTGLLSHFFEKGAGFDLSFHRFVCLAAQGASDSDIKKILRMAAAKLKEARKRGRLSAATAE